MLGVQELISIGAAVIVCALVLVSFTPMQEWIEKKKRQRQVFDD